MVCTCKRTRESYLLTPRIWQHKEHVWMSERAQIPSHMTNSFHVILSPLLSCLNTSAHSNIHCPHRNFFQPLEVAEPQTPLLLDNLQLPQSTSWELFAPSSSYLQSQDFSRAKHPLDWWCHILTQSYSKSTKSICTTGRRNVTRSEVKIWRSESEGTRKSKEPRHK